ncbi:hypothetical protein [Thioalkalivibrio sp. AKL17]|uniref:hypothetical protein n=1 Tax=Thioalkalivibrio sp. AKL17 TaxID=1158160 RepID=UPI0012DECE73|nr:hypothetical protein [Thioalkalivibrio sp. AKL17]
MKNEVHQKHATILVGFLKRVESRKRCIGHTNESQCIRPGEAPRQVIIRLVTCLLKLHKGIRYGHKTRVGRTRDQLAQGVSRSAGIPFQQNLTSLLHLGMPESTRHALPQHIATLPRDHLPACCIHQQMEKGIIGCGNGAPKARLARTPRLMSGKLSGLTQQIPVQRHPVSPSAFLLARLSHANICPEPRDLAREELVDSPPHRGQSRLHFVLGGKIRVKHNPDPQSHFTVRILGLGKLHGPHPVRPFQPLDPLTQILK